VDAEPTRVLVIMRAHKMLMEVSAWPWLRNYPEQELHSDGLELVLDSPTKKEAMIWWDSHHDCWAGRLKPTDGTNERKTASAGWCTRSFSCCTEYRTSKVHPRSWSSGREALLTAPEVAWPVRCCKGGKSSITVGSGCDALGKHKKIVSFDYQALLCG
jgi:hypothetical protein